MNDNVIKIRSDFIELTGDSILAWLLTYFCTEYLNNAFERFEKTLEEIIIESKLTVSKMTMSRYVKKLEEKGFVLSQKLEKNKFNQVKTYEVNIPLILRNNKMIYELYQNVKSEKLRLERNEENENNGMKKVLSYEEIMLMENIKKLKNNAFDLEKYLFEIE